MTPASFGLTFASFATFERRADVSVVQHTARLVAAVVLGAVLFFSSGSNDSTPHAATAAVHHVSG